MRSDFDAKSFLKTVAERPGVYQFFNADQEIIYVGKAVNLRKRLSSYFAKNITHPKTARLLQNSDHVKTIITRSETEALLLECTLIKEHQPRYNILMRDDKSYPYILLSRDAYPRLDFYRGKPTKTHKLFGPFPSTTAVRASLNLLQKLFKIRSCQNNYFNHRTRPCLQYQINRCTAPCVGYISEEAYQESVQHAEWFLTGRKDEIIQAMTAQMEAAAAAMEFEKAAEYRDQIQDLRRIQEQQAVSKGNANADVFAIKATALGVTIAQLIIRHGNLLRNQLFFPKLDLEITLEEMLDSFISQYYLSLVQTEALPEVILTNVPLPNQQLLQQAISEFFQHSVTVQHNVRGDKARWLELATENATHALFEKQRHLLKYTDAFQRLTTLLHLTETIQKIVCFDISHTVGTLTVASAVVFSDQGAEKSEYRRFNINNITPGDDYAAMEQALMRFLKRQQDENNLPSLLLIDGGKGQLQKAFDVLQALAITFVKVIGIAKGVERKPGHETLWLDLDTILPLAPHDPVFHLLQEVRDEAHRFAITGHRQRRAKAFNLSQLDQIPGIGAAKRQALLTRFGGMQALKGASIEEIAKVPGINRVLAERIYESLHADVT